MHADAEADAAVWFDASIDLGQGCLHLNGALNSLNRASELRKDTVARRVCNAAPMVPDELIKYGSPLSEALERADLVSAHEAAVALDICCEDRDKLPADFRMV